jgi:hypothetical protein
MITKRGLLTGVYMDNLGEQNQKLTPRDSRNEGGAVPSSLTLNKVFIHSKG